MDMKELEGKLRGLKTEDPSPNEKLNAILDRYQEKNATQSPVRSWDTEKEQMMSLLISYTSDRNRKSSTAIKTAFQTVGRPSGIARIPLR